MADVSVPMESGGSAASGPIAIFRESPMPVKFAIIGGLGGLAFLIWRSVSSQSTSTNTAGLLPSNAAIALGSLQEQVLNLSGQIGQTGSDIIANQNQDTSTLTGLLNSIGTSIGTGFGNLNLGLQQVLTNQGQITNQLDTLTGAVNIVDQKVTGVPDLIAGLSGNLQQDIGNLGLNINELSQSQQTGFQNLEAGIATLMNPPAQPLSAAPFSNGQTLMTTTPVPGIPNVSNSGNYKSYFYYVVLNGKLNPVSSDAATSFTTDPSVSGYNNLPTLFINGTILQQLANMGLVNGYKPVSSGS